MSKLLSCQERSGYAFQILQYTEAARPKGQGAVLPANLERAQQSAVAAIADILSKEAGDQAPPAIAPRPAIVTDAGRPSSGEAKAV